MKKISLFGIGLLLVGCTTIVPPVEQNELDIAEVSNKLTELQNQIEQLKTENKELKEEVVIVVPTENNEIKEVVALSTENKEIAIKPLKCGNGETFSLDKTYCVKIPLYAHSINSSTDTWACNEGYRESGNACIEIKTEPVAPAPIIAPVIQQPIISPESLAIERERIALQREALELEKLRMEQEHFSGDPMINIYRKHECSGHCCSFHIEFNHPRKKLAINFQDADFRDPVSWDNTEYAHAIKHYPVRGSADYFSGKNGATGSGSICFALDKTEKIRWGESFNKGRFSFFVLDEGKIIDTILVD